ncbi:MAG: sorbosone dehydrogenase family protein [Ferruginibacter sp.]|nr:sorbosone dehydrogenase family protein [Cytophagales bacterium]
MKTLFKVTVLSALTLAVFVGCDEKKEEETPEGVTKIQGNVFRPALVPATEENVSQLRVPAGFKVSKFAEGLVNPRMMAVSEAGDVYVTNRAAGTVTLLRDADGDGKSDESQVVASKEQMHGITIHNNTVYLVTVKEVFAADIQTDGSLGALQLLIGDLPDGGQHPNRTIAFGPDDRMYLTVGSTCNACKESSQESATILRVNAESSARTVFAEGLRNTIGFGWHPQTGELWGMDHGIDWLGDEEQPEELNQLVEGKNYGWPYIHGEGKFYTPIELPKDSTFERFRQRSANPTLVYQAHSAPLGMVFYTGSQFPVEYQNHAFITMRGSWNRREPSGYKVVRLHFENGKPTRFEDFLTGFLVKNNQEQFARLAGIALHRDGSLLVADDTNGVIYRVFYQP